MKSAVVVPLLLSAALATSLAGCKSSQPPASPAESSHTLPASAAGYRLYVTNEVSGDLSVIDPATAKVVATVPLGKRPRGIHASPDGKTLYIALSGSPIAGPDVDESTLPPPDKSADGIGVYDIQENRVVRTLHAGSDPENFDVSRDGSKIYVSNEDVSGVSIVDIASGTVQKTLPVGDQPEGVKVSPDGSQVYVTSEGTGTIAVLDLASGTIAATFKVGHRPRSVAFLPDGSRAYINAENDGSVVVVDPKAKKVIATIMLGKPGQIKPMAVLLSPDAAHLYVSTGRGHQVFSMATATNKVEAGVEVGARPWGIAVSPDGKTLFSANGPSNDVSVVDLSSGKVTAKVKAGTGPWGVVAVRQ